MSKTYTELGTNEIWKNLFSIERQAQKDVSSMFSIFCTQLEIIILAKSLFKHDALNLPVRCLLVQLQ